MMSIFINNASGKWMGLSRYMVVLLAAALVSACSYQSTRLKGEHRHRLLADQYYKQKEYAKAKDELQSILIENPHDVGSLFRLGVIYGNEGSTNASYNAFKKVISIDPNFSKAYYNLGVLYANSHSKNGVQLSIKYFDKFLEMEPGTPYRREIQQWKSRHLNH
jgi:tetratricopeptide (TPR) repeat protein